MDKGPFFGDARPQKERRRAHRSKLRIPSLIMDPVQKVSVPCTLVNLSDTGAGLEIDCDSELPDRFTLLIAGAEALKRDCVCVRRTGGSIGVRFQQH